MEIIKKIVLVIGFFVGLCASSLFFIWLLAGVLYVFSQVPYPGDIVYLPKWIFLFSPLVFLWKTKTINEIIEQW